MLSEQLQTILADPKVLPAIIGAGAALAVALLTTWAGQRKYQRERLWETRQAACNEIMARLYASSTLADGIQEGFDENPHAFYESDQLVRLHGLYGDEISAAHRAFQANYLILPSAFRRRYERLDRERDNSWYYSAGPDMYLEPIALNESARRDLFDLARAELRIAPWWSRAVLRWRPTLSSAGQRVRRARAHLHRWWKRRSTSPAELDF